MEGVLAALVILIIIGISFSIFIIYFIFKVLQFVVQAINLYKKIVNRQDATLKLLLDIRDNTKRYEHITSNIGGIDNSSLVVEEEFFECENCKSSVPSNAKLCPNCGVEFE